jgi:hypothetical protein
VAAAHTAEQRCSQCGDTIDSDAMFGAIVNHPLDSPSPVIPTLSDGRSGHCDDVTLIAVICLRCAFTGGSA